MAFLEPVASPSQEVTLDPEPGFVIKSKLASSASSKHVLGTKVFINVCCDEQVPAPEIEFNPSTVYPLIMENQWEIPIVTSVEKVDTDKKGNSAYVWDCCINSTAMQWTDDDHQLRDILVEWCLESVELYAEVEISREHIAFPKLKHKGELSRTKLLKEELNKNFKQDIEDIVDKESDPLSIIQAKRDLMLEDEMEEEKIELPMMTAPKRKPLIEEIEDFHITKKPQKPKEKVLESIQYETTFVKMDASSGYRLKIEIESQLTTGIYYELQYDTQENNLVLQHFSKEYRERKLEIPLPQIFAPRPEIKTYFCKDISKLCVFIK